MGQPPKWLNLLAVQTHCDDLEKDLRGSVDGKDMSINV